MNKILTFIKTLAVCLLAWVTTSPQAQAGPGSRLAQVVSDLLPSKTDSGLTVSGGLGRDVSKVRIEVGGAHSTAGTYSWKLLDTRNGDAVMSDVAGSGADCNLPISLTPIRSEIELNRMYSVRFTAAQNSMYMMRVLPMPSAGFRPEDGDSILNEQYKVVLRKRPVDGFDARSMDNGVDQNILNTAVEEDAPDCPQGGGGFPHPAPCFSRDVLWDFMVVPKRSEPLSLNYGDYPGDPSIPELGVGRSGSPSVCSFAWSVSMGGGRYGGKAGALDLRADQITAAVYTPAILSLERASQHAEDLEAVYNPPTSAVLRQVRGPQALADIVAGTDMFQIFFYSPGNFTSAVQGNGLYGVTAGSHFVKYTISKLTPTYTGVQRVEIKEERYQTVNTWEIRYEPLSANPARWLLIGGNAAANEQQTLTRQITILTNGDRQEWVTVKYNNSSTPAYEAFVTLHSYTWGWEVIREEQNPGTSSLIKDYTFYDGISDPAFYKEKMRSMIANDGYQEWYAYRGDEPWDGPGWLYRIYKPWGDVQFTTGDPANTSFAWTEFMHVDGPSRGAPCLTTQKVRVPSNQTRTLNIEGAHTEPVSEWINYHQSSGKPASSIYADGAKDGATDSHTYRYSPGEYPADHPQFFGPYWPVWKKNQTRYVKHGDGTATAYAYSRGTYDAATRTFTVDTVNGTYWRKEQINGTQEGGEDDPNFFNYAFGDDYYENYYVHYRLELSRAQSTKSAEIRDEQGRLIQDELYLFVPPPSANGTTTPAQGSDFILVQQRVHTYDALAHLLQSTYFDGTASGVSRTLYSATWLDAQNNLSRRKSSETDEVGVKTAYTYDSLDRLKTLAKKGVTAASGFPAQVDIIKTFTYDASGKVLSVTTQGGTLTKTESSTYDKAGRVLTKVDEAGLTTSYSYANGGRDVTTTLPGTGFTVIKKNYLDRRLKEVSGTAQVPEFYSYETGLDNESLCTIKTLGSATGPRWAKEWTSTAGVVTKAITPQFASHPLGLNAGETLTTTHVYNHLGQRTRITPQSLALGTPPDLAETWFVYNELGQSYMEGRGSLSFSLASRLSSKWAVYERLDGTLHWFLVQRTTNYIAGTVSGTHAITTEAQRISGFNSALAAEAWSIDALGQTTKTTQTITRNQAKIVETIDVPNATAHGVKTTVNGLVQQEAEPSSSPTVYTYDALGRLVRTVSPSGATQTRAYESGNDRVASQQDPAGNSDLFAYYQAGDTSPDSYPGKLKSITRADGTVTYYGYNKLGATTRTWGTAAYPEERIYTSYAELAELRLFRSTTINWNSATWPTGLTGPDTTLWAYDPSTGLTTSKTDPAGKSTTYEYYPDGRPDRQGIPRKSGVSTVYAYRTTIHDGVGVVGYSYSDGTPTIEYSNYDLRGLPGTLVDARGSFALTYDLLGRKVKEQCISPSVDYGTPFQDLCIENHFSPIYGEDYVQAAKVDGSGTPITTHLTHNYSYSASSGRMSSVADTAAGAHVTYAYLGSTDLIDTTTFNHTPAPAKSWTTKRSWEFGSRLQSIQNIVAGKPFNASTYAYDTLNRRTRNTQADGSAWSYDYNERDEVLSGKRAWLDGELVAGQQFEYGYDAEGNRLSLKRGGDGTGANLHQETYTANNLNQIVPATIDNKVEIIGVASATSSPLVNGASSARKGEYFQNTVTVANSASSVAQLITVSMTGVSSELGRVDVRKAGSTFTYDFDGTLLDDGLWKYTWNAEGRLRTMESVTDLSPASAKRKLTFSYDHAGRRFKKLSQTWTGSAYGNAVETYYVYTGWRLLGEFSASAQPIRTYMWGLDLSGSVEGAGTVGGLVMMRDHATGANYFPAYDGNGNVTGLIKASDLSVAAAYEYGPFGELIRASGPPTGSMARANPIRFSSKFQDDETGLLYYGHRFYSPSLGRWLSRDPIEEAGGVNVYGFVQNGGIGLIDSDGLSPFSPNGLKKAMIIALLSAKAFVPGWTGPNIAPHLDRRQRTELVQKSADRSKNKRGRKGSAGPGGGLALLMLSLAVASAEAIDMATTAAAMFSHGVIEGETNSSVEGNLGMYFKHRNEGDSAMSELDAVTAAILATDGSWAAALVMIDEFETVGEVVTEQNAQPRNFKP